LTFDNPLNFNTAIGLEAMVLNLTGLRDLSGLDSPYLTNEGIENQGIASPP
jgi:hypothetical protein